MNARSVIVCLLAAPLLIAAAPEPIRLKPSSKWVIDYAENSCQLIRTFGEGDNKTILLIKSTTPDTATMLASGRPLASSRGEISARFRPGGAQAVGNGTISTAGDAGVLWTHVPWWPDPKALGNDSRVKVPKKGARPDPVDLSERAVARAGRIAFASAITELEIDTRSNRPVILETGSLGEAVKMFDECGRDLLREWGLDPDVQDKIVRPVWTRSLLKWFTPGTYPAEMAMKGKESAVSARLIIDASGKVTSCTGLSHFDRPAFNEAVCDALSRAKFEPAELADGIKVPSYYAANIMFRVARARTLSI